MSESNLLDTADKIIKAAPTLYDDLAKGTAIEMGKLIQRVPMAINAAFSPIDKWILERKHNVEETKKLLAEKLKNVPPENIVPPDPHVAIPAINALSYSMDSNALREMYANLLAKSMIIETKEQVHPSFVDIIKQLAPNEVKLLEYISKTFVPLIDYSADFFTQRPIGGEIRVVFNFENNFISDTGIEDHLNKDLYVSNLTRVGLIRKKSVDITKEKKHFNNLINKLIKTYDVNMFADNRFTTNAFFLELTTYGRTFMHICSSVQPSA